MLSVWMQGGQVGVAVRIYTSLLNLHANFHVIMDFFFW